MIAGHAVDDKFRAILAKEGVSLDELNREAFDILMEQSLCDSSLSVSVVHYCCKVVDGPLHHGATGIHERMSTRGKGIVGAWWHLGIHSSHNESIGLEVAQCRS